MNKADSWEGAYPVTLRPITGKLVLNIFVRKTDENALYKVGPGILFVLQSWEEQEPLKLAKIRLFSLTTLMLWLLTSHERHRAQRVMLHRHSLCKDRWKFPLRLFPASCTSALSPPSFPGVPCPQPAGGQPATTTCSVPSSSAWNVFQSHLCHLSRKVIAVKDAAFSVLQPVWIILNRPKYLLVFKAPRVSYCYPNWKACALCHSLYKCVLESRAGASLYNVHLTKKKTKQNQPNLSLISALHLCWVFTWPVSWSWPQWCLFRSFTPV